MSEIQVQGLKKLNGEIRVQGSKNAVLPMMAGALLASGTTVIHHVPAIDDVFTMMEILEDLGCIVRYSSGDLEIDTTQASGCCISEKCMGRMRSSCLLLGPLLARTGEAVTYQPGGCVIGKRPVDLHLFALRSLGAEIMEAGGMIVARAVMLEGAEIRFRYPSVGATENAILAAVTAEGTTILHNCAREPEITELCRFLSCMGARIRGAGKDKIEIEGVIRLHPTEITLSGDRICAGTYLAAAMMTGGEVTVTGVSPGTLRAPILLLRRMGGSVEIKEAENQIRLRVFQRPVGFYVCTGPYPDFPTDLQSVFLAAACVAEGESRITETVFEDRFSAAARMRKFGAELRFENKTVVTQGRFPLESAVVSAPDLRGGAALVLAALGAEGLSIINDRGHISRGYEDICRDLSGLGANVKWIKESTERG